MHGLLSSDAEVEVCRVPHLVRVAAHLDPVTDRVTVHPVHHVTLVIHTLPIVMWAITWRRNSSINTFCPLALSVCLVVKKLKRPTTQPLRSDLFARSFNSIQLSCIRAGQVVGVIISHIAAMN